MRLTNPNQRAPSKRTRSPLAVHIGQQFFKKRDAEKLTMREVAEAAGFSSAFICQLENGQSMPPPRLFSSSAVSTVSPSGTGSRDTKVSEPIRVDGKVYCCCCGGQVVRNQQPGPRDRYIAPAEGARAAAARSTRNAVVE